MTLCLIFFGSSATDFRSNRLGLIIMDIDLTFTLVQMPLEFRAAGPSGELLF